MYRKKGRGWTKHIDFMLLDVLCMQIAFIQKEKRICLKNYGNQGKHLGKCGKNNV